MSAAVSPTTGTALYGVTGWPLSQSLSPLLHNTGFAVLGINALYLKWEVPPQKLPTFVESGVPDFVVNSWVGLLAPAGTPAAVVTRLNTELNAVLNDATVREKLRVMGIEPAPGTPEQYRDEIRRDLDRYGAVVKSAGISVD